MIEPIRRQDRKLRTLERPALPMAPSPGGFQFAPRTDAVLRTLSRTQDEREWRRMIDTDHAISSAIDQRTAGLLDDGWEIVAGPSSSPEADRLRAFVESAFCACDLELSVVLDEMLDAIFYGWRPVEVLWESKDLEGRSAWVPSRLIAHEPWEFRFSADGDNLIHSRGVAAASAQVFDLTDPVNHLRWLLCRSGSTRTPYGKSWLSEMWLLWFVRQEFAKMSAQGISRALGIFKAKRSAAKSGIGGKAASTSELTAELRDVLRLLDSSNILVEQGWSFEHLASPGDAVANLEDLHRYYDEQIRIKIVGQNLSSSVGSTGSFAAAKTHIEILSWYWKSDGRQLSAWMNRLIRKVVDLNVGPQAPTDYPHWTLRSFSRPDLPATIAFFNMGGKIDAGALASRLSIPAILDEPAEDQVVLERQPGQPEIGGATGSTGGNQPATARARAGSRVEDPRSRVVERALAEFNGDRVAKLYEESLEQVLASNPDPK